MNRVLRKAAAFVAALAVGASALLSTTASAETAKSSLSATQLVKNTNKYAMLMSNGALFIDKGSFTDVKEKLSIGIEIDTKLLTVSKNVKLTMVNNSGKTVSVKNTIGFTKIYSIGTDGNPFSFNNETVYNQADFVVVGVGDKYAVILNSGKYLDNGKKLDKVGAYGDFIYTVQNGKDVIYNCSGKKLLSVDTTKYSNRFAGGLLTSVNTSTGKATIYDPTGKKLAENINVGKFGSAVKYYEKYKNFMFWDGDTRTARLVSSAGKEIKKYVLEDWWSDNILWTLPSYEPQKADYKVYNRNTGVSSYYTGDGKVISSLKEIVKQSTDYQKNTVEFINTKTNEVIYSIDAACEKGDNFTAVLNGKIYVAKGALAVIDQRTGKLLSEDKSAFYTGIFGVSTDGKKLIVATGEKVETEYGAYYKTSERRLVDANGKVIAKDFDLYSYGLYSASSLTNRINDLVKNFDPDASLVCCKDGLYGLISASGKTLVKPKYSTAVYASRQLVILGEKSTDYKLKANLTVISGSTGKAIKSGIHIPNISYLGTEPVIKYSDKFHCIITCDSTGQKFGAMAIK